MKKVFDSFYVFSKFSLSFILLLCVFFLIYLLYSNYQNEDRVSKLQTELENELTQNINENSEFIKNISKEILETKTALTNIEKLIKENSNKESKVDLTPINESIELLNKNFNSLSYEITSIKNKDIEDQFNDEVNSYLKNIMKENKSLLNKILLPYLNLSPSSENIIFDEKILILEETKFFIKNRNITKAYDSISKIENYKVFFKVSLNEMNNYNNFIKEISKLNNV